MDNGTNLRETPLKFHDMFHARVHLAFLDAAFSGGWEWKAVPQCFVSKTYIQNSSFQVTLHLTVAVFRSALHVVLSFWIAFSIHFCKPRNDRIAVLFARNVAQSILQISELLSNTICLTYHFYEGVHV